MKKSRRSRMRKAMSAVAAGTLAISHSLVPTPVHAQQQGVEGVIAVSDAQAHGSSAHAAPPDTTPDDAALQDAKSRDAIKPHLNADDRVTSTHRDNSKNHKYGGGTDVVPKTNSEAEAMTDARKKSASLGSDYTVVREVVNTDANGKKTQTNYNFKAGQGPTIEPQSEVKASATHTHVQRDISKAAAAKLDQRQREDQELHTREALAPGAAAEAKHARDKTNAAAKDGFQSKSDKATTQYERQSAAEQKELELRDRMNPQAAAEARKAADATAKADQARRDQIARQREQLQRDESERAKQAAEKAAREAKEAQDKKDRDARAIQKATEPRDPPHTGGDRDHDHHDRNDAPDRDRDHVGHIA